ncbi:MAG: DUF3631 domain-containing protein [Kordiimonadaceae bacterium]|jgi:hypothetical protein|nr:DUF3631 domain-containing protein [Kordiimonadaceae bacterium]MBT6134161.1 DUF3631 domain-containing protein [Kordiimonadaceae bacterium]
MSNRLTEELSPYTGIVGGEQLLDDIVTIIRSHLVLPDGVAEAIALWLMSTYSIDCFRIYPKLFVFSPIMRCGKTTLLEVLSGFAQRSLPVSGITPAVVYRTIENEQPTLIIDEADQHLKNASGDMAAILNSSHNQSTARIMRSKPKTLEPEYFSTWAPMVIAAIGVLNATIMDRSIIISLKRITGQQKKNLSKIPIDFTKQTLPMRQKLLKWAIDNELDILNNNIEPPDIGNHRAQDNWSPLFTIAALISPAWENKCDTAYRLLEASKSNNDPRSMLLKDIDAIFQTYSGKNIKSEDLINALTAKSDSIWTEYNSGRSITPRGLAALLKDFGIKPKTIRQGSNASNRGYEVTDFNDALKRYI